MQFFPTCMHAPSSCSRLLIEQLHNSIHYCYPRSMTTSNSREYRPNDLKYILSQAKTNTYTSLAHTAYIAGDSSFDLMSKQKKSTINCSYFTRADLYSSSQTITCLFSDRSLARSYSNDENAIIFGIY